MKIEKDKRKERIINLKYNIKFLLKYFIILFYLIPSYHIYNSINEYRVLFLNNNEIRLKVAGPGTYPLINSNFINSISSIYLNNNTIARSSSIYFPNSTNDIRLSFSFSLTSCSNMFNGFSQIIEIDFSDFISYNVQEMDNMFYGCTSLKSIKFGNFKTSKIKNMRYVFYNCYSLETLDLSSFDTSNVEDFHYMFSGCKSLKSLDLSHFITSSCGCAHHMFYGCEKLEYVNFKNADLGRQIIFSFDNMITGTPKNIVFCFIWSKTTVLNSLIPNYGCSTKISNCSSDWRQSQKKIVPNLNTCVDNCTTTSYHFEYQGKCYSKCPVGTINNNYICLDCDFNCKECDYNISYCISCKD